MRRAVLILTLGAALVAAAPAGAHGTAKGGALAPETGTAATGGASYGAAIAPKEGPAARKRRAKKRRAARRDAKSKTRRGAKPKRKRRKPAPAPTPPSLPTSDHVFPVRGPFSFGGPDSRFGAGRKGHVHQGQDLTAPLGTPLVAPWAGTVEAVKYQAGGAGHYVVLDGDGEDRDYVFMHLRAGSTLVVKGQIIAKGQQLAEVGSTGSSSGPHLHFEIWTGGGWYTGGKPVDPLPFLQAWLN